MRVFARERARELVHLGLPDERGAGVEEGGDGERVRGGGVGVGLELWGIAAPEGPPRTSRLSLAAKVRPASGPDGAPRDARVAVVHETAAGADAGDVRARRARGWERAIPRGGRRPARRNPRGKRHSNAAAGATEGRRQRGEARAPVAIERVIDIPRGVDQARRRRREPRAGASARRVRRRRCDGWRETLHLSAVARENPISTHAWWCRSSAFASVRVTPPARVSVRVTPLEHGFLERSGSRFRHRRENTPARACAPPCRGASIPHRTVIAGKDGRKSLFVRVKVKEGKMDAYRSSSSATSARVS